MSVLCLVWVLFVARGSSFCLLNEWGPEWEGCYLCNMQMELSGIREKKRKKKKRRHNVLLGGRVSGDWVVDASDRWQVLGRFGGGI